MNPKSLNFKKYKTLIAKCLIWACFLLFAVRAIQVWVADTCRIPSPSMADAILAGDRIVVHKNIRSIARHDVIVFNHPNGGGTQLVKRCIGLPGDTVYLHNGVTYINGFPVETPPTVIFPAADHPVDFPDKNLGWTTDNYGPVITPAKGQTITTDPANMHLYREILRLESDEMPPVDTSYTSRTDCYFVLGDNRGNSVDSRYWGFVPKELIVGKAVVVYFSFDQTRKRIRWNRIGKRIK